jgi:tetratricopeptide (TPR) repeat protein
VPKRPERVSDVPEALRTLSGPRAEAHIRDFQRGSAALAAGRDREALRLLRPVVRAAPDVAEVHELLGLAQYRVGNYRAAARELEAFRELSGSVDEHPVLMDCYRAQRRWKKVDELWRELGEVSPSGPLVTEGRIVAAGALADRGRFDAAIGMLAKKADGIRRPRPHHLRLWYVLADLEERSGDLPAARSRFARIRKVDPDFADVTARLRALR